MDTQTEVRETAALVALVCSLARLELEEGYVSPALVGAPEVLDENRFLAAPAGSSPSPASRSGWRASCAAWRMRSQFRPGQETRSYRRIRRKCRFRL
jgi:gamma-glutamyl:cysteine ligase YbdK (ATP-grasp superfamily)